MQDLQIPAPLPLPTIKRHKLVSLVSSPGLRGSAWNRPSVTPKPAAGAGRACNLVAHARIPGAKFGVANGLAALQVDPVKLGPALLPSGLPVPIGIVASSFTTIELGTTLVRVFWTKSVLADRCTSEFGVTRQEQQEISCSSGENV